MHQHFLDNLHFRADALLHPMRGTAHFLLDHGEQLLRFQLDAMERYQSLGLTRMRGLLAAMENGSLPPVDGSELSEFGQQWLEDGARLVELGQRFGDGVRDLLREGPFVPLAPTA